MISNYLAIKLFDKILENTDFTIAVPYISLHSADPGITGVNEITAGTEGGSYARQPCTSWNSPGVQTRTNNTVILWTNTPYVRVTHWGLWDAVSGGNFLLGQALGAPIRLFLGERARFNEGHLILNGGFGFSNYLIPRILDKILGNTDFTVTNVYGSLHSGDPGQGGSSEIIPGANRPLISASEWGTPAQVGSAWTQTFINPTAGSIVWTTLQPGEISYFGLWDAFTPGTGNFLWGGELSNHITITGGSSEVIVAQNDTITAGIIS